MSTSNNTPRLLIQPVYSSTSQVARSNTTVGCLMILLGICQHVNMPTEEELIDAINEATVNMPDMLDVEILEDVTPQGTFIGGVAVDANIEVANYIAAKFGERAPSSDQLLFNMDHAYMIVMGLSTNMEIVPTHELGEVS
ncbi:hypothetical protein BDZ97DRAFT_2083533 [Flammula alnicola]|nr:hypothetical protein BDZ97DRAFT_2083533 [Flammula alnicola]